MSCLYFYTYRRTCRRSRHQAGGAQFTVTNSLAVGDGSGFRALSSRSGSGFVPSSSFTVPGSKRRVPDLAVAPMKPATNLELGTEEPGSALRSTPRCHPFHGCRGSAPGVVPERDHALRSTARKEQAVQRGGRARPACAGRIGQGPIRRNGARTRSGDTGDVGCRWDIQIREHLSSGAAVEIVPNGDRGEDFVRGHHEGDCRALRRRTAPLAHAEGCGSRWCRRNTAARGCEDARDDGWQQHRPCQPPIGRASGSNHFACLG